MFIFVLYVQSNPRGRYPDFSSSDQWSNNSSVASRMRSGSMSSGMNTMFQRSPANFNSLNRSQMQEVGQRRPEHSPRQPISNSVFDLNHVGQRNPYPRAGFEQPPQQHIHQVIFFFIS